ASFGDAEASPKIEEALLKAFRDPTIKQEVEELRDGSQVMEVLPNRSSADSSSLTPFPSAPLGARGEYFLFDTHLHPGEEGAVEHDLDRMPSPGLQSGWPVRIAAVSLLVVGLATWFSWRTSSHKP